jgi:His-Xaa-Ser system protein HxsD
MSNEAIEIVVDSTLFSVAAIQRTAFRFSETHSAAMSARPNAVHLLLSPLSTAAQDPDDLKRRFHSALLDEQLRERILEETRTVRDALVTAAFQHSQRRSTQTSGGKP